MRHVSEGHNMCVSGGPGTGKTLLSMALVECLQALGKKALMTGTTGLSASQLPGEDFSAQCIRSAGWTLYPTGTKRSPAYGS